MENRKEASCAKHNLGPPAASSTSCLLGSRAGSQRAWVAMPACAHGDTQGARANLYQLKIGHQGQCKGYTVTFSPHLFFLGPIRSGFLSEPWLSPKLSHLIHIQRLLIHLNTDQGPIVRTILLCVFMTYADSKRHLSQRHWLVRIPSIWSIPNM